ncbi:protein DJ-1 homolog D-like [Humulus lupulus]|uniref:protein DJ-1 homolog D-like n=1 Tax=Humulus lupulus TaxID=3486 RepID=UPI002B4095BC|nr:protein DJ-1 homolog D-like [Humulus lupulus]
MDFVSSSLCFDKIGSVRQAMDQIYYKLRTLCLYSFDLHLYSQFSSYSGIRSQAARLSMATAEDYMEDYEIKVPFQSLEALGCHVDAVCPKNKVGDTCPTVVHDFEGDQTYSEKPGHDFVLTANFEGLDASSYDALVIPGGRAPEYLALDKEVIAIVKHFMEANKPVASICHGQQILSAAGVLQGTKCTAYPAVKLNVVLAGATWLEPDPIDRCFTDGNLVARAAWPGHPEFVAQLMALLGIKVTF